VATTTGERGGSGDGFAAAVGRVLDRPLTSYHLVRGVTCLLLALGLVMVLSASSVMSAYATGSSYSIFLKQAVWVLVALPCAWVAARLPLTLVRRLSGLFLLATLALLLLTFTPLGIEVNGNRNWVSFGGPFRIQPSEVAKLALVLWLAALYQRKGRRLSEWRHLLWPMAPVSAVVAGLVVAQRDLGTALVLFAVILGMLYVVGAPLRLFAGAFLAVGALAMFLVSLSSSRVERLTNFANPFADYQDTGWQAAHGFFALANGGWWGVGLGASTQKWGGKLPEAHNDFIFAIIGEELGLFGTLVVLMLFGLLGYAGLRIATRTRDPFARYAAAGVTIWLTAQAMINIGMVLGLLPVIGIPLPLVSYGGSALVPSLVALGLLTNLARTEPGAAVAWRAHHEQSLAVRWGLVPRQRGR
jgi:cell division protein FtsW